MYWISLGVASLFARLIPSLAFLFARAIARNYRSIDLPRLHPRKKATKIDPARPFRDVSTKPEMVD